MESRSLLERISGRTTRELSARRSPQGGRSPPPRAHKLPWTDSDEDAPSPGSRRAEHAGTRCVLTSDPSGPLRGKPRSCVVVTDSSDEEFEKFLTQLKTPKTASSKALDKLSMVQGSSLKDFIVESDDEFTSIFSKSGKTSKPKNGIKTCDTGPERSQRNSASTWWDSPVFISDDSDEDDSIVIKSAWRDRHRTKPNIKTDNRYKVKSVGTSGNENTSGTEERPPGHRPKVCTSASSDEEFECLLDRIKNRTKSQTPRESESKIKPRTAATEPAKVPCFDLTNTKERKPRPQAEVLSSPYFSKDKAWSAPVHCVERTAVEKTKCLCKVEGCFLQDLSCSTSTYVKSFKQKKHELTTRLFSLYNRTIFDQKLPENLEITWNKKMRKTAGYCVTGQKRPTLDRYARIELSEKVCDSADRLRDTLIHELCHAATWLINGVRDGHGQYWKFYARKTTLVHPELPMVSRCHSYEINYKFTYECSRCKNTIGRHSKSLDTEKFVCSLCKGKLVLQNTTRKDGSPSVNQLTPFAKFVKENYGSAKKEMTSMSHAEVMRKLSSDFSTKTRISN